MLSSNSASFKDSVKNFFRKSRSPSPRPDADITGRRATEKDARVLAQYDTIFIIDDSGSMEGSSWTTTKEALKEMIEIVKDYDTDGIDIHFLNSTWCRGSGIKTQKEVDELFEKVAPGGRTPTGARLKVLTNQYLQLLPPDLSVPVEGNMVKPRNYIVITDGAATDQDGNQLEPVILNLMTALDQRNAPESQLGIQFVQVGTYEEATVFLKRLDDHITKHSTSQRDIVDTFPYSKLQGDVNGDHIVKMLVGSIMKRVDNYNRLG